MRFERRSHGFLRLLWIDVTDLWYRLILRRRA